MNIYIHIPFCKSKCAYCAFLSYTNAENVGDYFNSLKNEISERMAQISNQKIETIYFGGGTPSLVDTKYINEVIEHIKSIVPFEKDIEITLETNPEDITDERLTKYKQSGINRLSIGVQTLNNPVRRKIGRRLDAEEVLERIKMAKAVFDNVGVDLIAGLPDDDLELFIQNINSLDELGVKHISLYDLELDKDSYLATHKDKFNLLSEKEREDFLLKTWQTLQNLGFEQYEISNFAKDKEYSRHNLDFWNGKDYLGFGLGAVSRIKDKILTNTLDLHTYLKGIYLEDSETLSKEEAENLKLALSLRLNKPSHFPDKSTNILNSLVKAGLIRNDKLTTKGKILYNYVISELL